MFERTIEDASGFWISSQFYWKEKCGPEVYSENIDLTKGTVKIDVGP